MYAVKLYIPVEEYGSKPDLFHIQKIFSALHSSAFNVNNKFGILFPHMDSNSFTFGHEMVIYYESLKNLEIHFKSAEVKEATQDIPMVKINVDKFMVENKDSIQYGVLSKINKGNLSTPSSIKNTFKWMDEKIKSNGFSFPDTNTYKGFLFDARERGLSIEEMSRDLKLNELYLTIESRSTKQKNMSIFLSFKKATQQFGSFSDLNSYGISIPSKKMSLPIV